METTESPIVGIDLGTTNSVVAALIDGKIRVIEELGESILPSVVGLTLDGKLLVGQAARNQLSAFPERTVASIKRQMGQPVRVPIGEQEFSPQEISAIILRRLRQRASQALGVDVTRAVITVPAYFDEAQRQATREAGQLAGFTVERIINEPTAASVAYHATHSEPRVVMVYDLGGGTFDVSIVKMEAGVVEVLASKGDTKLGGDDFDEVLMRHVAGRFLSQHGVNLLDVSTTRWRLKLACEKAKCELSYSSMVRIAEEFIASVNGQPLHLSTEVTRDEYEDLIVPYIDRTIQCVNDAMRDSGVLVEEIDEVILVGGSTRTPLVQRRLELELQQEPQWRVSPDLAVALGAATQAAVQQGHPVGPVLIDVATHTLGIEAMVQEGLLPQLKFCPIIRRNAPLPAQYEEVFATRSRNQTVAEIHVYQGESEELAHNQSLGKFRLEGLNRSDVYDGRILVRFDLTLDGTLRVTAVEHQSGIQKTLNIDNALSQMRDRSQGEANLAEFFADWKMEPVGEGDATFDDGEVLEASHTVYEESDTNPVRLDMPSRATSHIQKLQAQAVDLRSGLSDADRSDVDRLLQAIEQAQAVGDAAKMAQLEAELDDLLFYLMQ